MYSIFFYHVIRGRIQRKAWCLGPYAGAASPYVHSRVDSNTLTMSKQPLQARVDLNPMPESTLSPSQGLWIWSQANNTPNAPPGLRYIEIWAGL
jgi:hypothetical protein